MTWEVGTVVNPLHPFLSQLVTLPHWGGEISTQRDSKDECLGEITEQINIILVHKLQSSHPCANLERSRSSPTCVGFPGLGDGLAASKLGRRDWK